MKINAIAALAIAAGLHPESTSSSGAKPNPFLRSTTTTTLSRARLRLHHTILGIPSSSSSSSPSSSSSSSSSSTIFRNNGNGRLLGGDLMRGGGRPLLCFQNNASARRSRIRRSSAGDDARPFLAAERNRDDGDGGLSPPPGPPPGGVEGGAKARLARATASLIARRRTEEGDLRDGDDDRPPGPSFPPSARDAWGSSSPYGRGNPREDDDDDDDEDSFKNNLIGLTRKIDQKILTNANLRSGQRRYMRVTKTPGTDVHVQHETDSMQSLLGYNHVGGEWSDRNSTTYHVAIVFGKPLVRDRVSVEYATRIRTLVRLLEDEPAYRPSLVCFAGGCGGAKDGRGSIPDASAGYVYFRHLCDARGIAIDEMGTEFWVEDGRRPGAAADERGAVEGIASELWGKHIGRWLNERPVTERLNQHYGVRRTILERKVDIHFTLVSTEYHLCNLNDVHHRSPGKSFLQPLVSLRGLVGSDRLPDVNGPPGPSARARNDGDRGGFGGIENSVDTSWSFQYGTYPFLHEKEDAIVFLGQCFLLGEELTPLLVNMKGVVEQTEFFQRDNYLLLSSIRRSLVSLVEALYTPKGQEIRAGAVRYFEQSGVGGNRLTSEDVKIIVVLESALLNLGRCIDMVKPAGLLVSSVPAATWSKALLNLEESMGRIKSVCDPDRPLEADRWGELGDDAKPPPPR